MRTRLVAVVLLIVALVPAASAASSDKERRAIAELATKLEDAPLAKSAKKDRQRVLTLISAAPDLGVAPCRPLLGDLLFVRRLEAQVLYVQLQISTAKFLAEHPDAAGDRERALTGGLEGVLRTYDAMHRTNPALTIALVDELAERAAREGLEPYVRERLAECP